MSKDNDIVTTKFRKPVLFTLGLTMAVGIGVALCIPLHRASRIAAMLSVDESSSLRDAATMIRSGMRLGFGEGRVREKMIDLLNSSTNASVLRPLFLASDPRRGGIELANDDRGRKALSLAFENYNKSAHKERFGLEQDELGRWYISHCAWRD